MFLNQQGQQFEPFRMLIFVIIAFVMLFFIVMSLQYFESQRLSAANLQMMEGLKSAAQAPGVVTDEKPLVIKDLYLDTVNFTSKALAERLGLGGEDCINLYSRPNSYAFTTANNNKIIYVNRRVQTDLYVSCRIPEDLPECKVACDLYFGILPSDYKVLSEPVSNT